MAKQLLKIGKWLSVYNEGILRLTYSRGYFDERSYITLEIWPLQLFIHLPAKRKPYDDEQIRYGFYYYGNAFWVMLGKKSKSFDMPWALEFYRHSVMFSDGTWEHRIDKEERKREPDFVTRQFQYREKEHLLFQETHPFTYTLKNGAIQERQATIKVEEREWRRKWLPFTTLFNRVERCIDVNFSDEVGERTGSWKGGTIGCGYEMKPGETPLETLRRMEKERRFT